MKRITLAAALALAAAVTACQPTTGPNANQPAGNANAAASATPTPAPAVSADEIINRERQLSDAVRSKNLDAFTAATADDMLYVTADGVYEKARTLEILRKLDLTEYTLSDFRVVAADKDAAVVTYKTSLKGSYEGQPLPPGQQYESSAWVNRGGRWLNVYHQDSEVMPLPSPSPTPAATASPAAAPASPAPTPPAAGSSATDMEKYVWDLFHQKNWDGFAAMLSDDFIEVEPNGVMNKAESVAGVRETNFEGIALSDFRELKLDADATLVTYVAKGSRDFGPQGMRHTSLWVNRGGRWLAVFHQGSIIKQ